LSQLVVFITYINIKTLKFVEYSMEQFVWFINNMNKILILNSISELKL
jgi:hypothetical protein